MAENEDNDLTADDASLELESLDLNTAASSKGGDDGLLEGLAESMPEASASSTDDAGAGFEDLDAFLSDFEQQQLDQAASALGGETPDEAEAPTVDPSAMAAPPPPQTPDPDASGAEDEAAAADAEPEPPTLEPMAEAVAEESAAPAAAVEQAAEQLDLPTEPPPEAEAPAAAPEPPVSPAPKPAASAAGADEAPGAATDDDAWDEAPAPAVSQSGGGRRIWVAAMVLMVIALGVALGATLVAFGLKGRVDSLSERITRLQSRPPAADTRAPAGSDNTAQVAEAMRQINELNNRVKELSGIIEGPLSHVRDSNQRELDRLSHQVKLLDARVSKLDAGKPVTRAPAKKPTTASAKPKRSSGTRQAAVEAPKSSIPAAGGWVINLASYSSEASARRELQRFHNLGINASQDRVSKGGKTWYRVQVTGFSSREQADAYAKQVKAKAGLKQVWVTQD